MSAGDALNEVAAARHEGRNVFAETCPQYLWLTLEETLGKPGFEGAKWVCSTPVRSRDHDPDYIGQMGHGHQGDLWKGLRMNELAVVSTDHCPFCMQAELLAICAATKTTVVFVTHSIPEAVYLSNRVVVMTPRPGRITSVVEVGLGASRNEDTREATEFFAKITEVREALRGAEVSATARGIEDR